MASLLAVEQTAAAAARALGWDPALEGALLVTAATTAWGLIEGQTRGRGCPVDLVPLTDPPTEAEVAAARAAATPPADLAAVALAATLRLAANPAQRTSESHTSSDGTTWRREGSFAGFTLTELMVLNRYRRRVR